LGPRCVENGKVLPNREKSGFAVEMTLRKGDDLPFATEFLPRSRSLETRIERWFPHSHSDGFFGGPIWRTLKSRKTEGFTDSCSEPLKFLMHRTRGFQMDND
jgi:hypothetical protein